MAQHHHLPAQCVHPGEVGQAPGYLGTQVRRATQTRFPSPVPPTPSLPSPSPSCQWSWLSLSLVRSVRCSCFINRPSRRSSAVCRNPQGHDRGHGEAQRRPSKADSSMRAPCPVGRRTLRLQSRFLQPTLLPPAMGPFAFMHCTCHELTLRQPAPKPACGTAPASPPRIMGPITIGA